MINEIAPHIFNNHYDASVKPKDEDFVLCYRENHILLKEAAGQPEIPRFRDMQQTAGNRLRYLFGLDSCNCFLFEDESAGSGMLDFHDVWSLRFLPRTEQAWIGAVGLHLKRWYDNNRYCGRCGTKNIVKENERAITCPSCLHTVYPQIAPAVIVVITCNDKILLARGKNYKGSFYALIAGYTDVGESLEETVVREVMEETGLEVQNIRYYMSQPWPFSGSMMVGFTAEADDRQPIKIDDREIEEAAWFSRGNLPPHATNISISGALIEAFEKGLF